MLKKIGKLKLFIVFFLIIVGIIIYTSIFPNKPPKIILDKKYQPIELKEDVKFLFKNLEEIHLNLYMFTDKQVMDSMVTNVVNKLSVPMTAFQFWELVQPIVAKIGDGHTFLRLPYSYRKRYLNNGGKILPMDIYINNNHIFVRKNNSSDSTLSVNSEILSINNIESNKILKNLREYIGGALVALKNNNIMRFFTYYLWRRYGFGENFAIKYISSKNDKYYNKNFSGITLKKLESLTPRVAGNYKKWTFKVLPDKQIGIFDIRTFATSKEFDEFAKFLKSSFAKIQELGIQNLIIDVRNNGGGESKLLEKLIDYLTTKPWVSFSKAKVKISPQLRSNMIPWYLRWIPIKPFIKLFSFMYTSVGIEKVEFDSLNTNIIYAYSKANELEKNPLRFHGNTYILINSGSFSASVIFAAVMKDYHFATLVGEETGELANALGNNFFIVLPNTHLQASVSSAISYRPSGKITGHGVIPDFTVKESLADRKNGIDATLKFTENLIRERLKGAKK